MRRSVLFAATIVLSLATAVGMFAAAIVLKPPPLSARTTDGAEVVHRFYDAINAALRTGDPAALDAVVAPHFTMHGAFVAVSPDRAGLVRQLVATSAVAPDLQLDVEDLAVADDRALVHVAQTSGSGGAFLGVPFAVIPAFWGRFDALRIEGGQVVELWSGEEPVPLLEPLRQARLDPLLTPDQAMIFRRLRAEVEHTWTWSSTFQSRVLYVEAGAITVEVDPASPAPAFIVAGDGRDQQRSVLPGERARLGAGEALTLSPVARYRLSGDPTQPELRAYEVAFPRFAGISSSGPGLANSTAVGTPAPTTLPTREILMEATRNGLPHDALIASFGRITLPPGRALALEEAPGPVLLTIEAGTLGIDQPHADPTTGATTLVPGAATIMPVGKAVTLQAVGTEPVIVFVVTIVPAHAGTRVVPSSHVTLPASESNAALTPFASSDSALQSSRNHRIDTSSRDPGVPVGDAAPAGVPLAPRHDLNSAPTPTATGLKERARPGPWTPRPVSEPTLLLSVSGGRVAEPSAGSGEERRLFLRRTALWLRTRATTGTPAERILEAEVAESHTATATHRGPIASPQTSARHDRLGTALDRFR